MRWVKTGALFLVFTAALPSVQATGLLEIYREALSHDAQYAAARATVQAGREKSIQGRAGLLPILSASANTTRNENRHEQGGNPQTQQNYTGHGYNVKLTQPVFNWQNYVKYEQGKLQVVQAESVFAQAWQDLILRVSQAYFDVLYAEEHLNYLRMSKATIFQQLEQAKKNFEVGTATITDSQEAQSRFDLASAQEIVALNDLEVKRYALFTLVGKDFRDLNVLRTEATLNPPEPARMDAWLEAASQNNHLARAQQVAAEIAASEIENQRAGHYPTIDAVANYGKTRSATGYTGNNRLESEARNVGLQLNIPLYQGGLINSKTREAAANRQAALSNLDNARRTAAFDAQQAFLGVVNGVAQVRALEVALKSSLSALESNKLGYEVGVRISIDVLNAEQQVFLTRRDLIKARFDALLAQLKLKAAVGALEEADLEEVNRLFERRKNG